MPEMGRDYPYDWIKEDFETVGEVDGNMCDYSIFNDEQRGAQILDIRALRQAREADNSEGNEAWDETW